MSTYTALVTKGDRYWIVEVPEVGRVTQARTLREVQSMAVDLIAVMEDVAADSVDVEVLWPAEIAEQIERVRQAQAVAEKAHRWAAATQAAAAHALADGGASLRDVGAVMGISYQRVHQLVSQPVEPTLDVTLKVEVAEDRASTTV